MPGSMKNRYSIAPGVFGVFCVAVILLAGSAACSAQTTVKACTILRAKLKASSASAVLSGAASDTQRLQQALSQCAPGEAVVLEASGANDAFLAAPLLLPRGVTLFLDRGVTLYASRHPEDYDLRPGSCGSDTVKSPGCKPFLFTYQAAFSGVAGEGTIDGQGNQGEWPRVLEQSKAPLHEGNAQGPVPDLVASYESQDFSVRGVQLKNAAGDSLALYKTIGFEGQDLHIASPR